MSAHSTLYISREKAIEIVLRNIMTMDSPRLEEIVDEIVETKLIRVGIHCDGPDNDDWRLG